jgi:hypothetical protein
MLKTVRHRSHISIFLIKYMPTLNCGAIIWLWNRSFMTRLRAAEMKFLRCIEGGWKNSWRRVAGKII